MTTYCLCSSASVYEQLNQLADDLRALGFIAVMPHTARIMQQADDYDITHYKTWYGNADDYDKKADLMRKHFEEIARSDAVLIANYEKRGIADYIGPNVLMEMGIAFYLHKPIYVLNELPVDSPFEEELKGFMPTILHGDLSKLAEK